MFKISGMGTMKLVEDFVRSSGLKSYPVYEELGEIISDALAIIGCKDEVDVLLKMESFNNIPGIAATIQLFEISISGNSAILIDSVEGSLATIKGHKEVIDHMTFKVGDTVYCTGILVTPNQ